MFMSFAALRIVSRGRKKEFTVSCSQAVHPEDASEITVTTVVRQRP